MNRRSFAAILAAAIVFALPASAAEFDWDGTWSGRAANGRSTVIKIAQGKVVSWSSNGQSQKIGSSSVSKKSVSITHAEGAKVQLTPRDEKSATYNWRGRGASSSAVLKKG
jgi:hypothetical protein